MRLLLFFVTLGVSSIYGSLFERFFVNSEPLELGRVQQFVIPENSSIRVYEALVDLQSVWDARVAASKGIAIISNQENVPQDAVILEQRVPTNWEKFWNPKPVGSFTIHRKGSQIYIRAADESGLINGVYAFCHDVFGARWYWSSDLGFEYVGEAPKNFPNRKWDESPHFVHRQLYPTNSAYGRRNRLKGMYQFNHNLAGIFSPELFKKHPEVFPTIRGVKRAPKGSNATDSMPDMTHWRTVEIAAEAALVHFIEKPESVSFSLSMNDNSSFDEGEATQEVLGELEYFRGKPNYSDYVFQFMNAVAEKVFDEGGAWQTPSGADRYLTALAYYWTEQSPSFKIHPRVMPILTADRAQWHDPEFRAEDRALIERWSNSGADRVGTWDYYFGSPYPYPRQFNQWISESIRYLADNDVRVFFSQLPSAWGLDGGKAWLTTRLLWNPYEDAEALLEEYYTNFFGPASEPIRAFYELSETHRNAHEGTANWIKLYLDEAGIELFPQAVLSELRDLIESSKSLVEPDSRYAARIQVVSDAFQLTEYYAAMQTARQELVEMALAEDARLSKAIAAFKEARAAWDAYTSELFKDPLHSRLSYLLKLNQSDPIPMALAALARMELPPQPQLLAGYESSQEVLNRWIHNRKEFKGLSPSPKLQTSEVYQARNFLGPPMPSVAGWYMNFRPTENLAVSSLSNGTGLEISGSDTFTLFTQFELRRAREYLLEYDLSYRCSPDNRVFIQAIWKNEAGEVVKNEVLLRVPNNTSDGYKKIQIPLRAPEEAVHVRMLLKNERQYPGDYLRIGQIQIYFAKSKPTN